MKATIISFKQLFRVIANDSMLIIICFGPVLLGLLVRLGVPALDEYVIQRYTEFNELYLYYPLIDLFIYVMVPLLICFIPAMVVLEEIDDKTSNYLMITPLTSSGYIISRIVYPSIAAFIITMLSAVFCSISKIGIFKLVILLILTNLSALSLCMLIICLAKNKVEGMAICKISSLILLGIPVPFFITNAYQYIFFFLPSFWIGKFSITNNPIHVLICLIVTSTWLSLLYKRFRSKLAN